MAQCGAPTVSDSIRIGVYTTHNPDGRDINGRAPGSDDTAGDSDTIEEHFVFLPDPDLINCPTAVQAVSLDAEPAAAPSIVLWALIVGAAFSALALAAVTAQQRSR